MKFLTTKRYKELHEKLVFYENLVHAKEKDIDILWQKINQLERPKCISCGYTKPGSKKDTVLCQNKLSPCNGRMMGASCFCPDPAACFAEKEQAAE